MTGNVAFDIVIGLVFVYLLYSLYATILMELISSVLGLRAKNLRYTLKRMLMNEKEYSNVGVKWLADIATTFLRIAGFGVNLKNPDLYKRFVQQPNIKYLGSGGFGGRPSYLSADSFSKGIIDSLKGPETDFSLMAAVRSGLEELFPAVMPVKQPDETMLPEKTKPTKETKQPKKTPLPNETKQHIISMMEDANNDPVKFKILLQDWFDKTMERSSGWFKQTTQIILLVVGAVIVISFNVDTIAIVKKLSKDKDARDQMVQMAVNFSNRNQGLIAQTQQQNDTAQKRLNDRLDSLRQVKQMLEEDIKKSQSILSSEWALPGTIVARAIDTLPPGNDSFYMKLKEGKFIVLHKSIDTTIIRDMIIECDNVDTLRLNLGSYKRRYAASSNHFGGFALTMLALSLGAPFWFDLLNKLVKLRSSVAVTSDTPNNAVTVNKNDILNRVG